MTLFTFLMGLVQHFGTIQQAVGGAIDLGQMIGDLLANDRTMTAEERQQVEEAIARAKSTIHDTSRDV